MDGEEGTEEGVDKIMYTGDQTFFFDEFFCEINPKINTVLNNSLTFDNAFIISLANYTFSITFNLFKI